MTDRPQGLDDLLDYVERHLPDPMEQLKDELAEALGEVNGPHPPAGDYELAEAALPVVAREVRKARERADKAEGYAEHWKECAEVAEAAADARKEQAEHWLKQGEMASERAIKAEAAIERVRKLLTVNTEPTPAEVLDTIDNPPKEDHA